VSRTQPSRPQSHDYEIGELVALTANIPGVDARVVCQVIGFRGETRLRLLPIGGVPVVAALDQIRRCNLPAGSARPPQRRRRWHKRGPKKPQAQTA
jgi:hypothetical protein